MLCDCVIVRLCCVTVSLLVYAVWLCYCKVVLCVRVIVMLCSMTVALPRHSFYYFSKFGLDSYGHL